MGSSPQYTGYFSPTYDVQLTDDAGSPINLTGMDVSTGFSLIMQNIRTLQFQHGIGAWTITDAANGKASYQWTAGDLAWADTFLVYVTAQLPGEPSPRAFDPDQIVIVGLVKGNAAIMATQDTNLIQVNGAQVSSANPVPISGPVQMADGANVTQGSKGDAAITDPTVSATEIALLKGLVKILALQGVAITGVSGALADGAIATLGTEADAAWSGSGPGTGIAILKKIEALLAATQVISGNVTEANSSAINTHLANIDTDSASLVTNTTGLATQATLALAKTDLDTIVTNTNKIPASPATEGGHLATIDSVQGAAADTNSTNTVMGRLTKIRDLLLGFVFDNTDRLKTSLYVKTSAAADTILTLGQATKANSLPVTFASDQAEPVNVGTPTGSVVSVGTGSTAVVTPGASAKFLLLTNDSTNTIYLNISGGSAALNAGVRLNANGGSVLFDRYIPSAAITAISSVASSNLLVEVG